MASPPRDPSIHPSTSPRAISIPGRDGSPIHRRRSSSQASETEPTRPRLSPTLARSLNPNDPEFRERQRTLDLDMAAHLSRARQNSVSISPVISPFHTLPTTVTEPAALAGAGALPPFSEGEEREFEAARIGGNGSAAPTVDIDSKSDFHFSRSNQDLAQLPHLSAGHDPELLFSGRRVDAEDRTPMQHPMHSGAGVHDEGGEPFLPSYAPQQTYESGFHFGPMEQFASEEKRRLGLESPTGLPNGGLRWMDLAAGNRGRLQTAGAGPSGSNSGLLVEPEIDPSRSPVPTVDGGELGQPPATGPRMRHRKLSQSKTAPRSQRHGPGKKTALFEGAAGAPPLSLGTPNGPRALSSYENVFGNREPAATTPGGLGHDRPYRFSFYSNALSATIHARSLAELPAEGQTFEGLFSGVQRDSDGSGKTSAQGTASGPDGSGAASGRLSMVASVAATPNPPSHIQEAARRISLAKPKMAGIGGDEPAPGYGTINPMSSKAALTSAGTGHENNTWWLDVLNPTDEEMKMLSKVGRPH